MQAFLRVLLFCSTCVAAVAGGASREAVEALSKLPLRFEPVGADQHTFVARGVHYGTQLSARETRVVAGGKVVTLRFEGARDVALQGIDPLRSSTNILRGNDRSRWQFGIPNFGRLMARGVYPGVDIVYYGAHGELEYDLVLHAGADPRQIRFRVSGAKAYLDNEGNLVAGAVHKRPITYQTTASGSRTRVESRFRRNADGTFGFEVAKYDRKTDLVIDPQLTMSAYVGGNWQDVAVAVGHDANGYVYIGGSTYSDDIPIAGSSFQTAANGAGDLFVTKIDPRLPADSQLVYSTYAGGTGIDLMSSMVVDSQGTVYMTGSTTSDDFPLGNAAQSTISGTTDAFVLWLDPAQAGANAMYYGSYLGGTDVDRGDGITLDPQGRIGIVGTTKSTDLAAGNGYLSGILGNQDAFVALIDPKQSGTATLVYMSYLGGTNWESGGGIAAAPDGTLWVTGSTLSGDFPIAGNAIQSYYGDGGDAFISQIDPNQAGGSSLLYSSYLGGSDNEQGNAIAVDPNGRVLVTGYTLSTDFPVSFTAFQRRLPTEDRDYPSASAFVFVMKVSNDVSPYLETIYSSYLGGTGGDEGYAIEGDAAGNIYVAGLTKSIDFPVTVDAFQSTLTGGPAGFLTKLNPLRTTLDYSSLVSSAGNQSVYGIDADSKGQVYVAGFTSGPLLEALGGVVRSTEMGSSDAFVAGFNTCTLAASPSRVVFPAAGGPSAIAVTGGGGCDWTAESGVAWVLPVPAKGTGNGVVILTAAENTSGAARTGTVTVAGTSIDVSQPAQ